VAQGIWFARRHRALLLQFATAVRCITHQGASEQGYGYFSALVSESSSFFCTSLNSKNVRTKATLSREKTMMAG
jgi:hypothetical protein